MKYVVYDIKYKVYNHGQETVTGLGLRSWGYDIKRAEKLTLRQAQKLAATRANCKIEPCID